MPDVLSSAPGLAIAVLRGDDEELTCSGVTSTADPLPVDEDTLFFIGSTSKTLTATAVMTHVEAGRLSLDDLVRDVLPEIRLKEPEVLDVLTVGMLMDHTSGFRGDTLVDVGWGDDALERAIAELLPNEPQVLPPGTAASYNNAAVMTVGRVLEVVSGKPFPQAVRDAVLTPLGMDRTTFLPWEAAGYRVVTGHVGQDVARGWPVMRSTGPGGGAASSLRDQVTWARFCLHGGPVLKDETRLAMQQPRIKGVGVSWLLQQRGQHRLVTHGGNLNNMHLSTFVLAPDEGIGVIVMGNNRDVADVGRELVDEVFGTDAPLTTEAPPLDLVGSYDAGAWTQRVTAEDGKLFIQMVLPEGTAEELVRSFHRPPAEVVAVGDDQLALAARPWDVAGDVGRDENGEIAWLRWGMRVMPRSAA